MNLYLVPCVRDVYLTNYTIMIVLINSNMSSDRTYIVDNYIMHSNEVVIFSNRSCVTSLVWFYVTVPQVRVFEDYLKMS